MAETFHGVEIPEEFWQGWNDPNSSGVIGFRVGVRMALGIPVNSDRHRQEHERLEELADRRDREETAAFEEKRKGQPWMRQAEEFRWLMKGVQDHG